MVKPFKPYINWDILNVDWILKNMETKCEPHCCDLITSSFSDGFLNNFKVIDAFLICCNTYMCRSSVSVHYFGGGLILSGSFQSFLPPFGELVKAGKERNAMCFYYSCTTRAIKQAAKVLNVQPSTAGTLAKCCRTSPLLRHGRKEQTTYISSL